MLLFQPVLIQDISTGCNSSRYLWPIRAWHWTLGTESWHDPIPMLQHGHRIVPQTGTKWRRRQMHRFVTLTGAHFAVIGTGSCHDPVPPCVHGKGTGWFYDPVPMSNILHRVIGSNRCLWSSPINAPSPLPLEAAVNSLFMATE